MKRILVVGDYQKGSGLTGYIMSLYSQIASTNKYEISCLSYSGKTNMDRIIHNKSWQKFDIVPITQNVLLHILQMRTFFKEHSSSFDIIHFNYSASWNFFGVLFAKMYTNSKIVVQSHNVYYSKIPTFFQKVLLGLTNHLGRMIFKKCSNVMLAVSVDAARWMFGRSKGVGILKNGIDARDFSYDEGKRKSLRLENSYTEDDILIGFVGTLEERKNPNFAIELIKRLSDVNSNYKLCMFGRGPMHKELEKIVHHRSLENQVFFFGVVGNLNEWYSALDEFIFPSKTEGFGYALLEAQANGLPSICSRNIPVEVQLTDTVREISTDKIDDWVNEITESKSSRAEDSKRNIKIIENAGYTTEMMAKSFEKIVDSL